MSLRADQVKMGKLSKMDRPGLAQPFMVPAKLKNQVRATPKTDLQFDPRTVGSDVQWRIAVQRPGLAQPLITAREEKVSTEAVVAAMDSKAAAPAAADKVVVAEDQNNKPAAGVAGWLSGWSRRR